MEIVFILLIISALIIGVLSFVFKHQIELWEAGVMLLASAIIVVAGYFLSINSAVSDVQIISGQVISKTKDQVSCRHSYECHCRQSCSGSGQHRSCHEVCQTCYEHGFDFDWTVHSTIGNFDIDTVDRQGLVEPKRWTSVNPHDPVSKSVGYSNWIRGASNSLFANHESFERVMPRYPSKIYDYYNVDRIVLAGLTQIPADDFRLLNRKISQELKTLAAQKQVNIVIVLTDQDPIWSLSLKNAWLGGKKNDLVIVIGTKNYPQITWVDVWGWSANDLVNVSTKDQILEHGIIDVAVIDIAVTNISQYWSRKPMSEFQYLKNEIEPSNFALTVLCVILSLVVGGLALVFINNTSRNNYRKGMRL